MKKFKNMLRAGALLGMLNLSAQQAVPSNHELYVEGIVNKLTEKFVTQGRLTFQPGPAPERWNFYDKTLIDNIDPVRSAHWSPDGTQLISSSSDDFTALIWSAETGLTLHTLTGHTDAVSCAAWSPDGSRVVTGSRDNTARIWDAQTGACLHVLTGHGKMLYAVAWSPDGTKIATASGDKNVRIWDTETSACLALLEGHTDGVMEIEWSPDGSTLLTASRDNTARTWDGATGICKRLLRHTKLITAAHWSPDGTKIATASYDQKACIWSTQTGECLMSCDCNGIDRFEVDWSPDSKTIVTVSANGSAQIRDVETGESFTLTGNSNRVKAVSWSPDCTKIATIGFTRDLHIYNPLTGDCLQIFNSHSIQLDMLEWSSDSTQIVTKCSYANPSIFRVTDADILLHNLKLLEDFFLEQGQNFKDLPLLRLLAELYHKHGALDRITKNQFSGGYQVTKNIHESVYTAKRAASIITAARLAFKLSDDFFKKDEIKKEELV